ncbi:MAG: hypothetical protein M3O25_10235 [Actinomycetota bacterium]|nr:hypothetical protein [Actinomycetota bacterium]
MERGSWTDERLDGLAEGMRSGFSRVDQDIRDLRHETREGFSELRGEIAALRIALLGIGGGGMLGLAGVIAAVLVRGA